MIGTMHDGAYLAPGYWQIIGRTAHFVWARIID